MYKSFTCERCAEEQTQELEGMFGANLQYGGIGFTTCWSCGNREFYQVEYISTLTEEQQAFWESWHESLRLWKEMKEEDSTCPTWKENEFKLFHQNRVQCQKRCASQ